MRGASAARCVGGICALAALLVLVSPAAAIEFFDDRLAIHGFYESQTRAINRDFHNGEDWDITQWYHVLNLEIEGEIAPDGWGPFDLISAFGRIEVRYDCVWRRSCYIFGGSPDAYGDRAKRLPKRVMHARRAGFTGTAWNEDVRRYRDIYPFEHNGADYRFKPEDTRRWVMLQDSPGFTALAGITGADGALNSDPDRYAPTDPFFYIFERYVGKHCRFANQRLHGSEDGVGNRVLPWDPDCRIEPLGALMDRANPLRAGDVHPISGDPGNYALPLRPAPRYGFQSTHLDPADAQGVWLPNHELSKLIDEGEFDTMDQHFRQTELEWNHGASQQDEKELKELYLDIELFDSQLWLRVGKQSIVWGKTELFPTTDVVNPRDLALASLPTLEESRISLWAIRAVWSFYNVGPLEDVRLELAMNFDQFEPNDLGRCGEPYSPLGVCSLSFGMLVHGTIGDAIAGTIKPPHPWNSWKGIEVGGRLEWRWDRFSFALTDFYGYNDFPYVDNIFSYSRNIDPRTGRPRWGEQTGSCKTGTEPACLTPRNALTHHSVNQTRFNVICGAAVGFSTLDLTSCGQTVFNSWALSVQPDDPDWTGVEPRVMVALTNILSGQPSSGAQVLDGLGNFTAETNRQLSRMPFTTPWGAGNFTPLVALQADPNDGLPVLLSEIPPELLAVQPASTFFWVAGGVQRFLTDEQEALLGCGPFYFTQCDIHGIDLMQVEGSVLTMSWTGVEGSFMYPADTRDASAPQPGTAGYDMGPIATRYEEGTLFILPGARGWAYNADTLRAQLRANGITDVGVIGDYDPAVDGTTGGAVHPFTGQPWVSEMAMLSWNAMIGLVTNSTNDDPGIDIDEWDPDQPFRTGGCSFAEPHWCSAIRGIFSLLGVQRSSVRAGGNGKYGRRDFSFHGGSDIVLRYEKRNVLGFSMDFAEDFTKTNWGLEFAWIKGLPYSDNNSYAQHSEANSFNLTVSIDRPTFINFLNQNRTVFFNSQWFFRYIDDYHKGFTSNGPWEMLATFTATTGYFQDRLLPGFTFVYDFQSNSGAALPSVTYRFTENFSANFGLAGFWGREEKKPAPLVPFALGERFGRGANKSYVENGLSLVRERDEVYLRIRYTF